MSSAIASPEIPTSNTISIEARNECDTNADTCCLGANWIILHHTTRTADVYPYDKSYQPVENVPIVTGATAYDDPVSGATFILVINEGLFYGSKLDHSLINPNQIRANGIGFWDNPYDEVNGLHMDVTGVLDVPLQKEGTKIFFNTRTPTSNELLNCTHVELTSIAPWNPHDVELGDVSIDARDDVDTLDTTHDGLLLNSISPSFTELKERLLCKVNRSVSEIYRANAHDDLPPRRTFVSGDRHQFVTANRLAENFCIGPIRAKATLRATTQRGLRSAILPLSRRYRADRMFNVRQLEGKYATDTLWAKTRSLNNNVASQIYSNKNGFSAAYHLKAASGDELGYSLASFIHDYGAPEHLTFDGAQAQVGHNTLFMKNIRRACIPYHVSQPRSPNENPAEQSILHIKKRLYRIMHKKKVPKRLWDFGVSWVCETSNVTANSSRYANGRTPLEIVTGETPDITEYLDFSFYDWIVFKSNAGLSQPELGRWLGVSHRVGPLMSYWILPSSGIPISCTTVQRLTELEKQTDEWKRRIKEYDDTIEKKLDADVPISNKSLIGVDHTKIIDIDDEDPEFLEEFNRIISDESIKDVDDFKTDPDPYLQMEIGLPRGDDAALVHARVKRRAVDVDGRPEGVPSNNPLLDTRMYEVEFIDGSTETIAANIIAENLLAQVDEEGHRQMLIDEIVDHRKYDTAISKEDGFYETPQGLKRRVRTTKGWDIYVQWKDGSGDWVALKDMKHAYPVQLAEYAFSNQLQDEPAFAWWVYYTLKKRDRIISKLKTKYWQRTHKYGIKIPKSVDEAFEIDRENKNNYWRDAIEQEMRNVRIAFEEYEGNPEELIGFQEIKCHMIFDVKLGENFRRKARYVAGGHATKTPASVTYSSVVSRDSVRLCLLLAALNGLDILSGDIQNAYLTAPNREKIWCRAGSEFGDDKGKVLIVVRALYGLKSAGAAFRAFLAKKLDEMQFKPTISDPDVWFRPAIKADGEEYYEYILVYVDDLLAISIDPMKIMTEITTAFKFKNDKIEIPDTYLGAKIQIKNINDHDCWTMTSSEYIKAAVKNVEEKLSKEGLRLPSKVTTPMSSNFVPELDGSPELSADETQYYQELIGILRWATELGRVDILTEVSMLSSYQASPRQGHLEQLYHIVAYLKKKPKLSLYFDPDLPRLDPSMFNDDTEAFLEHYRDAKEEVPAQMPTPRGRHVTMTAFVDASHASNKVTRRSHSGYIIFVNRAPILWYSKRQNTVESSAFSSEFIAMKTCVEAIDGLRYKLRMFGVPIDGAAKILCDNESVVNNSSKFESSLNKKHSSLAYHVTRWAVAAKTVLVGWIQSGQNLADAMTKRLSANKRDYLFGNWTY